ncbi:DUF7108 family protein [Haloarchaeobius amylolyticus]|uniref:DUF7108 family protein n=1 Tax=Haloarchaeobius amylolyticus TaxID=1198296 RepID=UPI00226F484A|nr:rnhA operon protein [Haloarchaeobius amylolyticus]
MPEDATQPDTEEPDDQQELPEDVVEEAERLTRLAREAVDEGAIESYEDRRTDLLADHEFTARVRDDDDGETLVLHPEEWVEDGVIRTDRIEDTDRAVEVSLSGPGDAEEWENVAEHNDELVAAVAAEHGDVHASNARKFADFMGNHYARPADSATSAELQEFLTEYYPRNAWPTEEEEAVVETSLRLVFETAEKRVPDF